MDYACAFIGNSVFGNIYQKKVINCSKKIENHWPRITQQFEYTRLFLPPPIIGKPLKSAPYEP